MDDFNSVDSSSLPPAEAAHVYNYQGNCYYQSGKYDQAIEFYKKWRDACKKANNQRCAGVAGQQIEAAQRAIKTGGRS
jgi:tetratricopeptide (TPR) repeat protein